MGLLEDFETLEKQQTDSIEYYLSYLILKDRYPITMNLDEFCEEYFAFQNHSTTWDKRDPDHCFRTQTNLIEGRVYIACGIDGGNVSKFASERIVLIGTLDAGFRKITTDELHQYAELYQKQWPDSDYTHTLNQTIHHLLNKYTYHYGYNNTIAIDDPNRGFNYELI